MNRPNRGDRIVVALRMRNEPDPIPVGATGTVLDVTNVDTEFEQVLVNWDPPNQHRTLMLVPQDYDIIRRLP